MLLSEFRRTIDMLAERYPDATVDFCYPRNWKGKPRSHMGNLTSYSVTEPDEYSSWDKGRVRLIIEYAREKDHLSAAETAET